jgi:hypothetical protein
LKGEKGNEKAKVAPKKARGLGLDGGACELVGRKIRASSTARSGKRKEQFEKGVGDYRRLPQPIGSIGEEEKERQAARDQAQEDRRHQDEACRREGSVPAWIREWPAFHEMRFRLE